MRNNFYDRQVFYRVTQTVHITTKYLKSAIRSAWILFALFVLAIVLLFFAVPYVLLTQSGVLRFRDKNEHYYSEFARGCDSLLAQHPLETNGFFDVSVRDTSLPKIIKGLHPDEIRITRQRVWIRVGDGRAGFAVIWEPQSQTGTNSWVLTAGSENFFPVVYEEKRR